MQESVGELMTIGGYTNIGDYRVSAVRGQFLSIVHSSYDEGAVELTGWKFHISLDEGDRNRLLTAYQQIAQIVTNNSIDVSKFKTFKIAVDVDSHPSDHGRQATIYVTPDTQVNWKELLESITRVLIDLNIPPGYPNPVCRPVSGSNYISYRNDQNMDGSYISCRQVYMDNDIDQENKYNPGGHEDPFLALALDVENQLERQNVENGGDDDDSCCCRLQ